MIYIEINRTYGVCDGKHDDVIKWEHFRVTGHLYGEFTGHRDVIMGAMASQITSLATVYSTVYYHVWINGWLNSREAGDLRRHRTHYDVTVIPGEFNVGLWRIFSTGRLGQCNFVGLSTSFPCFRTKSDCVSNLLALYIVECPSKNEMSILTQFSPSAHLVHI